MDKKTISTMKKMFDDIMHTTEDGTVEFWYARELMGCLDSSYISLGLEAFLDQLPQVGFLSALSTDGMGMCSFFG